ncbi:MAG TPA: winged helix-turn-helix domain-containing protein [Stenotrophomonas sp.]|nr:winged helix-turn-helix domain-containing protein [Stenotrophomonas sp.]
MSPTTTRAAQPERLRVGECVVDIASREVHAPGARRPTRLTPKAMAVLRVLAEQPGQVVSREQLLAEVWPDTLPTNDVVTQAITQLRKALQYPGDEAGRAGGIETIAKTGYRLLAPVRWEAAAPVATTPPMGAAPAAATAVEANTVVELAIPAAVNAPAPFSAAVTPATRPYPRRRHWPLLIALALLAAALATGLWWWLQGGASATPGNDAGEERVVGAPRLPYRLITSGGGFDLTPTLSPDGSMVAFASLSTQRPGTSIRIQTTSNSPSRELVIPGPRESDRLPAWSPDGRQLAFARQGEDGSCRIMVAATNGAAGEHEVARCDHTELLSFSWVPGRNALLFGTMTGANAGASIRELDLDTGTWRALNYGASARDFDYAPKYSPDGRWIGFVRNPQLGGVWIMPASGGAATALTHESAEIRGWDWLPDSSGLVFGRRVDAQSRLYRLDLKSQRLHDLGLSDAESPTVSQDNGQLAFVQRRPQFALYRMQRNSAHGGYSRERLFPSNGRDAQPMVSPDGRQLAFTSDRSGEYALWWADLSRPDSLHPIAGLVPETRQPVDWAPDAGSLLAIGRDAQGQALLYEVTPAESRVNVLPVPAPRLLQGLHVGDPTRILVLSAEPRGDATLILYDRSQQPWRELARLEDVSQARYAPDTGQVFFTRFSASGLWHIDAGLTAASLVRVDGEAPSRWRYRSWALAGADRAYYLSSSNECSSLGSWLGAQEAADTCLAAAQFSTVNGFSIDVHDGALYVAIAATDGAGIGFMALPKAPAPTFGVISKLLYSLRNPPS